MSTFLFFMGFFVLFLSFFITPIGTSNALMISVVLFFTAVILSKRKKGRENIYKGGGVKW
ncbi:hypothetical protein [Halobacillus sp. B23F22_1]|uniref:hypothetical protein n=1 Tax=Halobacillus sp. B23F22_1 TaxID=3459514 RepID=UPI00373FA668